MQAWRIAKRQYALDRTGAGGLHVAGRWSPAGVPVIYAGLSVEICVVEKLVHTGATLPDDLVLVAIELPDDENLYETVDIARLPGWDAFPPRLEAIALGEAFLRAERALGLVVPSAVVPEARNLVINPRHARFAEVGMTIVRPFRFDPRLRGAK